MIEWTVILVVLTAILYLAMAGIRRFPWRYAGLVALGNLVFFAAVRLTTEDVDPVLLVGLGAIGASLATSGHERGQRARAEISASILSNT